MSISQNATLWTNESHLHFPRQRTVFNIVVPTSLVIITYLLACLIVYGTRMKKWTARPRSRNIFLSCFISVALGIPCCIAQMSAIMLMKSTSSDSKLCEITADFAAVTTFLAVYSIHGFLWHRQAIVNSYSTVRNFTPKIVRVWSWIHLFLTVCLLLYLIIRDCFTDTREKCYPAHNGYNLSFLMLGYGVFSQLAFTIQFLYPMIKVRRLKSTDGKRADCIYAIIRRCLLASTIIVSTDVILLLILALRTADQRAMANSYLMVDVDIVVNQFAMLLTFKDFGCILKSPLAECCCCERTERRTVVSKSTMPSISHPTD